MSDLNDTMLPARHDPGLIDHTRQFEAISTRAEHEQSVKYSHEIKRIIQYLIDSGQATNKEISDIVSVQNNNLSQFLDRTNVKPRASNISLRLYRFVLSLNQDIIKDTEAFIIWNSIIDSRNIISDENEFVYRRLISHMDSSVNRINRVGLSYNGVFYMYRYSIVPGRIVKTKLTIESSTKSEKMWMFKHEYKDAVGTIRISSGALMTLMGNVYCVGKIGSGLGFEIIVFREPASEYQPITQALIMSLDTKYQPVTARASIRYCGDYGEEDFGNYDAKNSDISKEIEDFKDLMSGPKCSDKATSLSLL